MVAVADGKSCLCGCQSINRRATEDFVSIQVDECRDDIEKQPQSDLNLITSRLRELEAEHAEPERRDALRRRKKQLKEVAGFVDDKQKNSEDKVAFLVQRVQQQVCT